MWTMKGRSSVGAAATARTSSSGSGGGGGGSGGESKFDSHDDDAVRHVFLHDEVVIPATMAEALDLEDPVHALRLLSNDSQLRATKSAEELLLKLQTFSLELPDVLKEIPPHHPIHSSTACADSILHSLTKIASGGSQASQEIRQLEQEKRDLDEHAEAVAQALELRQHSDLAAQAFQARAWQSAAEAIRPWLDWNALPDADKDPRVRAYTGEYAIQQLSSTYQQLKTGVIELYMQGVENGDLRLLGELTPALSTIHLEHEGVKLYLQFLRTILQTSFDQALHAQAPPQTPQRGQPATPPPPPYAPMARVYNEAVACLRHHLPMVSHCLHRADGDVAVVQLIHVQVEESVLPLIAAYQDDRQLATVSQQASRIYAALEERYAGRTARLADLVSGVGGGDADGGDPSSEDCGFSIAVGSLPDVDAAMEEVALCIQHCESYLRFVQHTCQEVNNARKIRFDQAQKAARLERERQGWATGRSATSAKLDDDQQTYAQLQILSHSTPLQQAVAEVGGQYAGIERCLLLASMQRGFASSDRDPRYYRPMVLAHSSSSSSASSPNHAMQTMVVDACLFAARRGTQRAFATGHTGTASAMTNFCVDCLSGVLLDVLSNRAEESGVALLKPGEGLLGIGATGIFHATNLIRQGGVTSGVSRGQPVKDEATRKRETTEKVAKACAVMNDLEVACHRVRQLEVLLSETIEKGYPSDHHDTEQLRMCVKALRTVSESFTVAANSTVESLESVLTSRIRSIVGEAVGTEGSTAASFMGSSVMGGGKGGDRVTVRMNYNLDDDAYNLQQLSEGYVSRLCTLLDELLNPLRTYLAPRLWDSLLCNVLGTISKRLEVSLRKCEFTALGGFALDADMRDLLNYAKDRLFSADLSSNIAITRACLPLARLIQISKLLSVDDLEDVLDLISSAKRKNNWDLKLEETKAFLSARVEFDSSKVQDVLRLPDE